MATGGILWIWHLETSGRPTVLKNWMKAIQQAQRRGRQLSFGKMMPFITKEGGKFLMKIILQIGVQGVTQRHYNSFLLSYRGLAKSGHNVLSKSGITSSYTAYSKWLRTKKESIAIQGRSGCSETMSQRHLASNLITSSSHLTPEILDQAP